MDVTNDLSFTVEPADPSVPDKMNIRAGRAQLSINGDETGFASTAMYPGEGAATAADNFLQIEVWQGALPLVASALFFKTVIGLLW